MQGHAEVPPAEVEIARQGLGDDLAGQVDAQVVVARPGKDEAVVPVAVAGGEIPGTAARPGPEG